MPTTRALTSPRPRPSIATAETWGSRFRSPTTSSTSGARNALTGKSLGTDLEKQKLTLPVIRLLEIADSTTGESVRRMLSEAKAECRKQLVPLLEDSGALDYSWQRARWHVREAVEALECLGDSEAKAVLRVLADYTVRRAS